jgi:succinylarginine dihydrolase
MQNGGGPACLRLRIVMTEPQRHAMHQGVVLDDRRHEALRQCIETYWPDTLRVEDLADPALVEQSQAAVDAVRTVLELPCLPK